MTILHVTTAPAWAAAQATGAITRDETGDGFLHLCTEAQLPHVLANWFAGVDDVLVLEVDDTALGTELRWEPGAGGEDDQFPHLYGPLPVAACRARPRRS